MSTTQVGQDNVALVKSGYDAFAAGDMAALMGLYDPDAAFYTVPRDAADGNYFGRDAIFAYFGELHKETAGTFKVIPVAMAGAGDRVFVFQELHGSRNGRTVDPNSVMVFTIANGLVREMREYVSPHSEFKAFWA